MSSLKTVIVFLAVLYCSLQDVFADLSKFSKYYKYGIPTMITGMNYFDDVTLVHAVRDLSAGPRTFRCQVIFEIDAFDITRKERICDINIQTEQRNGEVFDIIGVNLWGKDKAILLWRETTKDSPKSAFVRVTVVYISSCAYKTNTIETDLLSAMEPQVFLTLSKHTFDVAFVNTKLLEHNFVKSTVDEYGSMTTASDRWFSNKLLITEIIPITELSPANDFLVVTLDIKENKIKFFLLRGNKRHPLKVFDKTDALGYSANNGQISICSPDACTLFDYNGSLSKKIKLVVVYLPRLFAAVYNLPNDEILAVTCHISENDKYYITKIGSNGLQSKSLELDDLKCNRKPSFFDAKFIQVNRVRFCLSIVHPVYTAEHFGDVKFSKYCFSLDDFS